MNSGRGISPSPTPFGKVETAPATSRIHISGKVNRIQQSFQLQPSMDLTKYNSKGSAYDGAGGQINSMRGTSYNFGGFSSQFNTRSSPRGYSPRDSGAMSVNNRGGSMSSQVQKTKEFALFNNSMQYQLKKDQLLRMREVQLRKKYEGIDPDELKDTVSDDPTHPTFKTNPLMKPLITPLSEEELLKQSYIEIFQRTNDGRKKSFNYANFSMEKYNLINHSDLVKKRGENHTPLSEYHQQFFDRRANYDHLKLHFSDTRMAKPHLLQNLNQVAASQMSDPVMRQEVQENRKYAQLSSKHHIIRNIIDVKRRQKNMSVQHSPKPQIDYSGTLIKRQPRDPIINANRPFNVSNNFNVFDNLDQKLEKEALQKAAEESVVAEKLKKDEALVNPYSYVQSKYPQRRAQTQINFFDPHVTHSQEVTGKVGHQISTKTINTPKDRPQLQGDRITIQALRKIGQSTKESMDQLVTIKGGENLEPDHLSTILDSLKPQKKLATPQQKEILNNQNTSIDSSSSPSPRKADGLAPRLSLPSKLSVIDDKSPLTMSDAAMQKRLKNLEEYVNQKKKLRDREDAMSVASQLIESYSKNGDTKSQMSKQMKHLDLSLLSKTAVGNHVLHARLGAPIETITEEKTGRQRSPNFEEITINDVTLDNELLQKLNNGQTTRRAMNIAMVRTARRSPRYLGKYDDAEIMGQEQLDNKQYAQLSLLTQRKDNLVAIEQPQKAKITIQEEECEKKRVDKKKKNKKATASIKVAASK